MGRYTVQFLVGGAVLAMLGIFSVLLCRRESPSPPAALAGLLPLSLGAGAWMAPRFQRGLAGMGLGYMSGSCVGLALLGAHQHQAGPTADKREARPWLAELAD